ncbi:MAG: hypothetical protein QOF01_2003 [Thermomicrobiales bacterium]|jgi:hypothetical protein|nr:hypothetical protein [Thermomicrobiales bacterium]
MHAAHALNPTTPFPGRIAFGLLALLLCAALTGALIASGSGGWQALGFALAPDLALFVGIAPGLTRGQLHPRAVPLLLGLAALLWLGVPWLVGALSWSVHVAVDRAVGYGRRTPEGFRRA